MESVLSFRIRDAILGINIDNVKWILDIDGYEEIAFMPPYVYGKIAYNDHHYFLISINEKLKLDRFKDVRGKYGIVININTNEFVIAVDEILHIKELAHTMNNKVPSNMFMEAGKVGEFLNDSFFEDIINLKLSKNSEDKEVNLQKTSNLNLLLFTIGDELFAIESRYIESVQIIENNLNKFPSQELVYGILHHADQLIKVLDTKRFFQLSPSDYESVLIIARDNTAIGLGVDTVINTFEIPQKDIEQEINKDALFFGHFLYQNRVCHIIKPHILETMLQSHGLVQNKNEKAAANHQSSERFLLLNDNFAIPIDAVHVIKERQDVELLRTLDTAVGVESFINIGEKNYYLFNLAHLFENEEKGYNFVVALADLESDFSIAIGVNDIIDLVEAQSCNIFTFQEQGSYFIRGTFDYQKQTKKILDLRWLYDYIDEKVIS